jgi:hypothetical protein
MLKTPRPNLKIIDVKIVFKDTHAHFAHFIMRSYLEIRLQTFPIPKSVFLRRSVFTSTHAFYFKVSGSSTVLEAARNAIFPIFFSYSLAFWYCILQQNTVAASVLHPTEPRSSGRCSNFIQRYQLNQN